MEYKCLRLLDMAKKNLRKDDYNKCEDCLNKAEELIQLKTDAKKCSLKRLVTHLIPILTSVQNSSGRRNKYTWNLKNILPHPSSADSFSLETILLFCEMAIKLENFKKAEEYIDFVFQRFKENDENQ